MRSTAHAESQPPYQPRRIGGALENRTRQSPDPAYQAVIVGYGLRIRQSADRPGASRGCPRPNHHPERVRPVGAAEAIRAARQDQSPDPCRGSSRLPGPVRGPPQRRRQRGRPVAFIFSRLLKARSAPSGPRSPRDGASGTDVPDRRASCPWRHAARRRQLRGFPTSSRWHEACEAIAYCFERQGDGGGTT